METAAGMPSAIKTWWYPGERRGYELVYPKEQAQRLAQGTSQPVLTTQASTTTTEQTNTTSLARVSSAGQETMVQADATPSVATLTGGSQRGELAASSIAVTTPAIPAAVTSAPTTATAAAPAAATAAQATVARTSLPKTASHQPLVALLGALTFGTGVGLWMRPGGGART